MSNLIPYEDMRRMGAVMARSRLFGIETTEQATAFGARLFSGARIEGECWVWTRSVGSSGYGKLRIGRSKDVSAHRAAYAYFYGALPDGTCVLHQCDVRRCINPRHLFLGSKADNSQDMVAKGRHYSAPRLRTVCPKGHPYSGTNSRGARICRICQNVATLAHYHRTKAAA